MKPLLFSLVRTSGSLACLICLLSLDALALEPVPVDAPAKYPAWWFRRGLLIRKTTTANPHWPQDYLNPDDFAIANIGQLKAFATAAFDELEANLPGGAGSSVSSVIKSWFQLQYGDFDVTSGQRVPKPDPNNYAAVNAGQLKAVLIPFYSRLEEFGASLEPLGLLSDNYSSANIGQMKHLFSFSGILSGDTGNDWDLDGDGKTYGEEIQSGGDPRKKDHPAVGLRVTLFVR